jgi:hypothetical protein
MQIFFILLLVLSFISAFHNFVHYHNKSKALEGITSIQLRMLEWVKELIWELKMRWIYDCKKWMFKGDLPPFKEYLRQQKELREAGQADRYVDVFLTKMLAPLMCAMTVRDKAKRLIK